VGEGTGEAKAGKGKCYFEVVADFAVPDDFESDDLPSDDLLPPSPAEDEAFGESDFSDFSDFSDDEDESPESDELSDRERLAALRLSVRWKPEPLNTMPTGWRTLASLPPHPGCFFSGSSENDCHSSISSPHLAHS
jgi:hypothetical protein